MGRIARRVGRDAICLLEFFRKIMLVADDL